MAGRGQYRMAAWSEMERRVSIEVNRYQCRSAQPAAGNEATVCKRHASSPVLIQTVTRLETTDRRVQYPRTYNAS
jgi:hypothetical protein